MDEDRETPWYRPLVAGLGALLGVALLVGGVISVVALGAVTVSGIGSDDRVAVEREPSLYIPERTATPDEDDPGLTLEDQNGGAGPSGSASEPDDQESRAAKVKRTPRAARSVISLSASPQEVSAMERIYLSGTYPGGDGASPQVQRLDGAWADFPTSTWVSGQTFSTYVLTGRSGANRFRVVDAATGKKSNPVTVTVR